MKKINLIKNFWKRSIGGVVVTPLNGFEYLISLYSFKKKYMGCKTIPHYKLNQEIKALGLSSKLNQN